MDGLSDSIEYCLGENLTESSVVGPLEPKNIYLILSTILWREVR